MALVKYNLKLLVNLNVVTAFVLILLAPVLFSFQLISKEDLAKVGELYLSLIGIVLFPFLPMMEERGACKEVVYVKKLNHRWIDSLRLFMIMVLSFLFILSVILFAEFQGGVFPFWSMATGVWISALFFGMLGLTVANLTRNLTAAYLIPFAYFSFEFMTKGKYTKDFFVLSLLKDSFTEKYWILLLVVIMVIFNLIIKEPSKF